MHRNPKGGVEPPDDWRHPRITVLPSESCQLVDENVGAFPLSRLPQIVA
jgi:hypothetical protein